MRSRPESDSDVHVPESELMFFFLLEEEHKWIAQIGIVILVSRYCLLLLCFPIRILFESDRAINSTAEQHGRWKL